MVYLVSVRVNKGFTYEPYFIKVLSVLMRRLGEVFHESRGFIEFMTETVSPIGAWAVASGVINDVVNVVKDSHRRVELSLYVGNDEVYALWVVPAKWGQVAEKLLDTALALAKQLVETWLDNKPITIIVKPIEIQLVKKL